MARDDRLSLAAGIVIEHLLRLAGGGGYHPYGNPNATGDPHGLSAMAEHHMGNLGGNHLAVVQQHLKRAAGAAASGDHTAAEMHYRDAARRVSSQLGASHPMTYAVRAAAAQHRAAAHGQMGMRDRPGAGAGAGLPSDVQHALGRYDEGHRTPAGSALERHIGANTRPGTGRPRYPTGSGRRPGY